MGQVPALVLLKEDLHLHPGKLRLQDTERSAQSGYVGS